MLTFLLTSDLLASYQCDPAPVGYANLRWLWQRDERFHGVSFTGSTDLTFWKRGGAYLRTLYDGGTLEDGTIIPAQGIEAVAALTIFERDPNEFRTDEALRMRVDFTQLRSSESGVAVKLKQLGFQTTLLARADTAIDLLPAFGLGKSLGGVYLPNYTPTQVQMHSQVLRLKYEATSKADKELSPGNMFGSDDDDPSHQQILYFGFDSQVVNDLALEPFGGGFVAGDANTVTPIYRAKENGTFVLDLALYAQVEAHTGTGVPFMRQFTEVGASIFLRTEIGGVRSEVRLQPEIAVGNLDGDYVGDISVAPTQFIIQLQVGDSIALYGSYYVHGLNGGRFDPYQATITATMKPGSYLRITADSTTEPTSCRGLLPYEALSRIVDSITDASGGFYSEYFGRTDSLPAYAMDGPGSLALLTNGFGLRGYPLPSDGLAKPIGEGETDPRKPLTASFNELYTGLDAIHCLGAGFEQRNGKPTLRIEPRSYFFQPTVTLELGAVQGLVKSPYTPLQYNAVEVGYQHWQSGAAVGLDAFNGQRTYSLPLTQVKATYSTLSSLNTEGYLIEGARRQPFSLSTNQEGQADQELFLIALQRPLGGGFTTERAFPAFQRVEGILAKDTAYNLRYAPGRNLRRHGAWLRAGLAPQAAAGKALMRGEVAGNDKLLTQLATETTPIDEHADVPLTDLAAPYFFSETYEFTAKLRRHQVRQLTARPYGLIAFLDGSGARKQGYLLKVECEPESGKASFTLLRAAA